MDPVTLNEILKNRSETSIAKVYDLYAPALYGIILRTVKSHQQAELILEKTFVKIFDNLSVSKNHPSFFTWMVSIARSTAQENAPTAALKVSADNVASMDKSECVTLLEGMKTSCKEVLNHLYFEGYSLTETSKVLGTSLDSVKAELRSALQHVSQKIKS